MRYCHFGVSPVNYSDSDSDSATFILYKQYLEIITSLPSHYKTYRPGSSIFAQGPLGPRTNMERGPLGAHEGRYGFSREWVDISIGPGNFNLANCCLVQYVINYNLMFVKLYF